MTPEGKVKDYLARKCKAEKWKIYTAPALGMAGWPDRMILPGGGVTVFIELKAEGYQGHHDHVARQQQILQCLARMGHLAIFAVGKAGVDKAIIEIRQVLGGAIPRFLILGEGDNV